MQIVSVNLSPRTGTVKQPVPEARVGVLGLEGDAHAGEWTRQVSLLGTDAVGPRPGAGAKHHQDRPLLDEFEADVGVLGPALEEGPPVPGRPADALHEMGKANGSDR